MQMLHIDSIDLELKTSLLNAEERLNPKTSAKDGIRDLLGYVHSDLQVNYHASVHMLPSSIY